MEYTLLATPEEMTKTAQNCEAIGSKIANTMSQIKSVVDSLRSVHEGDSATAFNTQFHKLDTDVDTMNQRIKQHISELNEIANIFSKEEIKSVDSATSLPDNVF